MFSTNRSFFPVEFTLQRLLHLCSSISLLPVDLHVGSEQSDLRQFHHSNQVTHTDRLGCMTLLSQCSAWGYGRPRKGELHALASNPDIVTRFWLLGQWSMGRSDLAGREEIITWCAASGEKKFSTFRGISLSAKVFFFGTGSYEERRDFWFE